MMLQLLIFLIAGGHGGISVTANIVPKELQKVYLSAIAGNEDLAKKLNLQLINFHKNLFIEAIQFLLNGLFIRWESVIKVLDFLYWNYLMSSNQLLSMT